MVFVADLSQQKRLKTSQQGGNTAQAVLHFAAGAGDAEKDEAEGASYLQAEQVKRALPAREGGLVQTSSPYVRLLSTD